MTAAPSIVVVLLLFRWCSLLVCLPLLCTSASSTVTTIRGRRIETETANVPAPSTSSSQELIRSRERSRHRQREPNATTTTAAATNGIGRRYGNPSITSTTLEGGNGAHGAIFSITARRSILVTTLDIHTDKTYDLDLEVYTKPGGYAGHQGDLSVWTRISNVTVAGRGKGNPTAIPESEFDSVQMERGEMRSFYVTLTTEDLRYTNADVGLREGGDYVATPSMVIHVGTGVSGYRPGSNSTVRYTSPFDSHNSMFGNRVFNGIVHYEIAIDNDGDGDRNGRYESLYPYPKTLNTTYHGGSRGSGAMSDVVALRSMLLTGFDVHLEVREKIRVEVWTRNGSYRGHEADRSAWTRAAEQYVDGQGLGQPTPVLLPFSDPILVPGGQVQAFYVTVPDTGAISYTAVGDEDAGSEFVSNDDVQFFVGVGVGHPFGTVFSPRVFNGAFHYAVAESSTSAPTSSPTTTQAPTSKPPLRVMTQQWIRVSGVAARRILQSATMDDEDGSGTLGHAKWNMDDGSVRFFEGVTRAFLQQVAGNGAGVTVTSVAVSRNVTREEVLVLSPGGGGLEADRGSDGPVLNMYTNITGEYYPPPYVKFGELIADSFVKKGEVFVQELKKDPVFEEATSVGAVEVVFPILPKQYTTPHGKDGGKKANLLRIVYAICGAILFLVLLLLLLLCAARKKQKLDEETFQKLDEDEESEDGVHVDTDIDSVHSSSSKRQDSIPSQ